MEVNHEVLHFLKGRKQEEAKQKAIERAFRVNSNGK